MRYLICILFVFCASNSFSQNKVKLLNAGNKEFQKGNFEKADSLYQKSKEKDNLYYKENKKICKDTKVKAIVTAVQYNKQKFSCFGELKE